jgi:hypothetical protein
VFRNDPWSPVRSARAASPLPEKEGEGHKEDDPDDQGRVVLRSYRRDHRKEKKHSCGDEIASRNHVEIVGQALSGHGPLGWASVPE